MRAHPLARREIVEQISQNPSISKCRKTSYKTGSNKRGLISRQLVSFEVNKMACRTMEPEEFEMFVGMHSERPVTPLVEDLEGLHRSPAPQSGAERSPSVDRPECFVVSRTEE